MGITSPFNSKRLQRRKTSSGAPLVRILWVLSRGVRTTTDISRRWKSNGISSSFS